MAGESLRVLSGNAGGKEIPLEDEFLIGRAAAGEGKLGDGKEISRSYVGWDLVPIDARTDFLSVEGTDADSPADRAGLRFGDAIVELDNTPVGDVPAVCDIVNSKEPGDRLKVAGLEIPTGRSFVVNARLR